MCLNISMATPVGLAWLACIPIICLLLVCPSIPLQKRIMDLPDLDINTDLLDLNTNIELLDLHTARALPRAVDYYTSINSSRLHAMVATDCATTDVYFCQNHILYLVCGLQSRTETLHSMLARCKRQCSVLMSSSPHALLNFYLSDTSCTQPPCHQQANVCLYQ